MNATTPEYGSPSAEQDRECLLCPQRVLGLFLDCN